MYAWWNEHAFIHSTKPLSPADLELMEKSRTFSAQSERSTQRRFKAAAALFVLCALAAGYVLILRPYAQHGTGASDNLGAFAFCSVLALFGCLSVREIYASKRRCKTMQDFMAREGSDFIIIDNRFPFWKAVVATPEWNELAAEMRAQTTIGSLLISTICAELLYNCDELTTPTRSRSAIVRLTEQGKELGNRVFDQYNLYNQLSENIVKPHYAT